jgi:LEA14-like dessication related protein
MKRFLFAVIAVMLLSSCFTIKPVEFKRTENFSVSSNNNSPMVTFGLVFYNPNKFGCTISDIESEGSINDRLVFNAGVNSKVRAKSRSDVTFPVTANLAKMELSQLLGTGLNLLLNDEAIPMKVKGKLKVRRFIFSKTYHFDYTQSIDKAWLRKLF